jgi:hypothetical protein
MCDVGALSKGSIGQAIWGRVAGGWIMARLTTPQRLSVKRRSDTKKKSMATQSLNMRKTYIECIRFDTTCGRSAKIRERGGGRTCMHAQIHTSKPRAHAGTSFALTYIRSTTACVARYMPTNSICAVAISLPSLVNFLSPA